MRSEAIYQTLMILFDGIGPYVMINVNFQKEKRTILSIAVVCPRSHLHATCVNLKLQCVSKAKYSQLRFLR